MRLDEITQGYIGRHVRISVAHPYREGLLTNVVVREQRLEDQRLAGSPPPTIVRYVTPEIDGIWLPEYPGHTAVELVG